MWQFCQKWEFAKFREISANIRAIERQLRIFIMHTGPWEEQSDCAFKRIQSIGNFSTILRHLYGRS